MSTSYHEPVMRSEVVEHFRPVPDGVFVDATVGGGGHARAVLEARTGLRLVGLDRDEQALAAAAAALADHGARISLHHASFDQLAETLDALGIGDIVGVLFDLGISSAQVDQPERGFSYRADGPLDMRMDRQQSLTAADIVNHANRRDLADILRRYGDERFAQRIAAAIVAARPVSGTADLAEIVRDAIPAPARRRGGHPAKRTFQALRIAVNDELERIEPALHQAVDRLATAGRGAVLTYHSGEDRTVKRVLRREAGRRPVARGGLPPEPAPQRIRLIPQGSRTPTSAEVEANPRAASARMRGFERVAGEQ